MRRALDLTEWVRRPLNPQLTHLTDEKAEALRACGLRGQAQRAALASDLRRGQYYWCRNDRQEACQPPVMGRRWAHAPSFNPPGPMGLALWSPFHGWQKDEGDEGTCPRSLSHGLVRRIGTLQSGLKEELVTLGKDWEACEAKRKGNKWFVLPFFPGRKSPLQSRPPLKAQDIKGGDSRWLSGPARWCIWAELP